MTIAANEPQKITTNGNGVATVFSFSPMIVYENNDIFVTFISTTGVETLLTEGAGATNYSVSVASFPGTGSITYPASGATRLAVGEKLVIKAVMATEQTLDLENQGGYFPDLQETALDKLVKLHIQQQEELDRTLKYPIGDPILGVELPAATARANKGVMFDATGAIAAGDATGISGGTWDNVALTNARQWDAVWINARQYSSLNAAVTAIGANEVTLVIPHSLPVTATTTVPATLTLMFIRGAGGLSIDAGVTVTHLGNTLGQGVVSGAGTFNFGNQLAWGTNALRDSAPTSGPNTGHEVIAIGHNAMAANTTGHTSIAIGYDALKAQVASGVNDASNGTNNIAIGSLALKSSVNDRFNIGIGSQALSTIGGSNRRNVAVGHVALRLLQSTTEASANGTNNTAVGAHAGELMTTGNNNALLGFQPMGGPINADYGATGADNVAVGVKAFLNAGSGADNAAVGSNAMALMKVATGNVAVGRRAMLGQQDGSLNSLNTSGVTENVAVGLESGLSLTTGSTNVLVGAQSGDALTTGSRNTFIGHGAGGGVTTGTNNIMIGQRAGETAAAGTTNELWIHPDQSDPPMVHGNFDNRTIEFNAIQGQPRQIVSIIAPATTFAVTRNFQVLDASSGAVTIATITGGVMGSEITLLFTDANITITDDNTHAANTIDLSAPFTSADDAVLKLVYDSVSWYEVSRSAN